VNTIHNHNILYIVSCLERGGLELRLLEFTKQFPENIVIHICVTSNHLDLLEQFQASNARVIVIPIKRAYLELGNIRRIVTYLSQNNIRTVNTFDFKGLMIGCFLKLLTNSDLKLIHNTVDLLHSYSNRQKHILGWLFSFIDKSVCNSTQARDVLVSIGINKSCIEVINNGVDTGRFYPNPDTRISMRDNFSISDEDTVIGTVANFRWEKNYPFLIDSFCRISKNYKNLKLLCVGGGPELEKIKSLAEAGGIIDKVIFTGSVENVPDYLQMMDLFVLCSIKESFPNCMIQAMSCGVPVVTSDIGACTDIIEDGVTGLKFTVNDSDQFVGRIETLLNDTSLCRRIASNGCRTVTQRFSQTGMINSYVELIDTIVAGPSGSEAVK
jgi:glycosyltransferase involved in cell wall biosynthesis